MFCEDTFFIATLHVLHKVLPHVCRLSRIFQKEDVFTLLRPFVDATYCCNELVLNDLKEVDTTLSSVLKDYNIHMSDATKDNFDTEKQNGNIYTRSTYTKSKQRT